MNHETQQAMLREIRKRIRDYNSAGDIIEERDKLIRLWKEAHPDCVNQPASLKHHPLEQKVIGVRDQKDRPEHWENDIYHVTVRRWSIDPVFGSRDGMISIGIHTHDGTARHDWREFQQIKNQLAGPQCEAFELYPAESRLLDPSNYYTLWCFPGVKRIKVGLDEGRRVLDTDEAMAPQRGFEK